MKTATQSAIVLLLILMGTVSYAQLMDYTAALRQLDKPAYFRFHYDNDYFTKTDEYYSQGICFEYVAPGVKKFFLSRLLLTPYTSNPQYGVGLHIFGYTATSILSDTILNRDRPFEANISLQTFSIQSNAARQQKIASAFSMGIMGPAALGYDIQYNIHKWTGNPLPHGWEYQVKNDVIINYQLNYEKQLVVKDNYFLLNAVAEARLGTLNDKINTGINFMAGRFNKRYQPVTSGRKKTEYYFYAQGRGNLIGYDASLQGGLFNRNSPYTISASDVNRVTFQADAGIVVNFNRLYLSYTQSYLTKEFRTGKYHRWGGISVGFAL